jgi:predicted DsbA family dithiol-disulfide isomerase
MTSNTVSIAHFSDALCVWAYVSQIRCDELLSEFPGQVSLDCRFFQVFGNVPNKIRKGWSERGGIQGYSAHVRGVVDGFPHVSVHPEIWTRNTPASSMPAHLLLCAIRLLEARQEVGAGAFRAAAWLLRAAFFQECADVGARGPLLEIAEKAGVPAAIVSPLLDDGRAHAALCEDVEIVRDQEVRASPTLTFNEGRQRLTGNVGYRILEANVRELLQSTEGQSSWC